MEVEVEVEVVMTMMLKDGKNNKWTHDSLKLLLLLWFLFE